MKPISKPILPLVLGFLLTAGAGPASADNGAFSVVASGDAVYAKLHQLEEAGLLLQGSSEPSLTRFEVAQRLFKARVRYKEIVVAQADMDLPPPPPDDNGAPPPPPGEVESTGGTTTSEKPSLWNDPQKIAEAEKALKTLEEAYQFELGLVRDQKTDLEGALSRVEAAQYDLWKGLKGITQYPSLSVHGVGRAFVFNDRNYGAFIGSAKPYDLSFLGYLDLELMGSVDKAVRWDALFRYSTNSLPLIGNDGLTVRRISLEFNPDFMSATFGDFEEAYTPLTLWNRSSLDLFYRPETFEREDDLALYEKFFDHEPYWPLRGLRMGTSIGWPGSGVLEVVKVSAFGHMMRSGFANSGNAMFLGPTIYTDWLMGGNAGFRSKKWYVGGTSWQVFMDSYGVILDQPLDTNTPNAPYSPFVPATWAHQYLVGSVKPSVKIGFGGDFYAGLQYEGAFASYQDDKRDMNKIISDYALTIGPFFQLGDSKLTFTYLNIGPNYYSPMAQKRQESLGVFAPQFFLASVPRAGQIFDYYDRTYDNTFPYGMASPNRQGFGFDLDVEALKHKSLKVKGAAYFMQEISGNLVVNMAGTGYTGLDSLSSGAVPVRNFTYVNVGPSFDLGPHVGLETPLEIGTNVRYEQTTSAAGTLNGLALLGGIRAGFFSWWEGTVAFMHQSANGQEQGLLGTAVARYSYLFDNADLGDYSTFNIDETAQTLKWSSIFKFNKNSRLYLTYSIFNAKNSNHQNMEMLYEIEF